METVKNWKSWIDPLLRSDRTDWIFFARCVPSKERTSWLGKCFEMVMEGQQDILKLLPDIENESRSRKSVTYTTGHSVVEGVRYCVQRALNKLSEPKYTTNRSTFPPPPPYRP